jgi:myosin heavy subunit
VKDRSEGGMGNDDMEKKTENMYKYITEKHEKKSEKVFKKIRNSTKFVLMHSAKDVIYDTKFFIERNADSMSESLN